MNGARTIFRRKGYLLTALAAAVLLVIDEDMAPVLAFDRTNIVLGEESSAEVLLEVMPASPRHRIPPALSSLLVSPNQPFSRNLTLRVSYADAIQVVNESDAVQMCPTDKDAPSYGRKALYIQGMRGTAAQTLTFDSVAGTITVAAVTVATLSGAPGARDDAVPLTLNLEACGDHQFQDMSIELALDESRIQSRSAGNVTAGGPAMISISSNDAIPTVEFFPTDVYIDEGGEHDVLLSASGENAEDVMMATLRVEHDETDVGLYYKDGDKIEPNADGTLTVKIMDGQVRLTAKSYSDPDLMDGDMAKKTWIIMSADDAEIGDGYWYTVNVSGSTAVPALPLVGQLLLALFLMAGGARLYRRRQV